jgi:hypothetical protein
VIRNFNPIIDIAKPGELTMSLVAFQLTASLEAI